MNPHAAPAATGYTLPAIVLHWVVAVLVIGMLALGYFMEGIPRRTPERAFFVNLHKSLGLLTALIVLARIGWRARHPPPPLPASMPRWEAGAARWSHRLLYAGIVVQPVAGYLSSSFNRFGVRFFGLPLPQWGWDDPQLRQLFLSVHVVVAMTLVVLIVVHVLAALKHLVVSRNQVFQRMLPWRRPLPTQ